MRRQGDVSRSSGYQNTDHHMGTSRINQGIDNVPSRTQVPRSSAYLSSYPSVVPTASEAIWGTDNQFSRQIANDSPFQPFDLSDSDDDVDEDDNDGSYIPETILEWGFQGGNRSRSQSSSDDSYALSDDATRALEDVWAEFTASQSQAIDAGSSSDLQRQQSLSPVPPSMSSLSLEPLPSFSPVRGNHRNTGPAASQEQSVHSTQTTSTSTLSSGLDLVWRRSIVQCIYDGA